MFLFTGSMEEVGEIRLKESSPEISVHACCDDGVDASPSVGVKLREIKGKIKFE